MASNAAAFASIINKANPNVNDVANENENENENENGTRKDDSRLRFSKTIAGINLDLNRFSELSDLEGRFWDSNSNANASGAGSVKEAAASMVVEVSRSLAG